MGIALRSFDANSFIGKIERAGAGEIGDWNLQHLRHNRRAFAIARHLRHDCGEIAPSAGPADRNTGWINAQVRSVLSHPNQSGVAVFRRHRELVFGREAIIDRNHHATERTC